MPESPSPSRPSGTDDLRLVALVLCDRCIAGEGGECHTPGCALWMNRAPDVPLTTVCDLKVELREVSRDFAGAHVNAGSVVGAVRKRIEGAL